MKKTVNLIFIIIIVLNVFSCTYKTSPDIDIKLESVQSIDFKRTAFSTETPFGRDYFVKSVTDANDVKALLEWIEGLKLEKQQAIEIPTENVEYLMILNGVKNHKLIFFDNYVVYDSIAYTYENQSKITEVSKMYNMLNYEEKSTELNILGD